MSTTVVNPAVPAVPSESKVIYLNEQPPAKAGFTVKDFTGEFNDPNTPGVRHDYGYWDYVPSTIENCTALANVSGKGGKPLQDKNFAEMTGIYKLVFDGCTNIVRKAANEKMFSLLQGPAVKIEAAVEKLMKIMPKLTRAQALVLATAAVEQEQENESVAVEPAVVA